MTPTDKGQLLSIILLSYFSEKNIRNVYTQVVAAMERENIPFELIIMDDGSTDHSYQVSLELEKEDDRVVAYQLSRNYTSHYSLFAGLSVSKGACATAIPDDLQLPLETVITMYRHWQKGNQIIIPFRSSRDDGKVKDAFSNLYYKIMNSVSVVQFPVGGSDGFLIDREVIDIINEKIHPINTSTIVEVLRLGFNPVFIPFDRPPTKGKSRWTLKKKLRLAFDTILSSSSFPIKLIVASGVCSIFLSAFLILFSIVFKLAGSKLYFGFSIPGWTSNLILISFFSGLILFSLGIIAEYVWRIYEEVKDRPGFIIKRKE